MGSSFDSDIAVLEREVLALKQQKEKSAELLRVSEYRINLSFEMEIHTFLYSYIRSKYHASIIVDVGELNPLLGLEFDVSSLDNRIIESNPMIDEETGKFGYLVSIYSSNQSDYDTLNAGGSVTLNYTAIIKTTADAEISVNYKNIWPY